MTKHQDPAPERFDLRSLDIAAEKRAELLRLFPECATEGGKVDFERLKAALGAQIDAGKERYGLTWPGKAACFQTIQRPSLATLRPKPGESVDFDNTQNLIIEGDNLEVLKLLQKSYVGKVKMIYIDPPYNTGNDFIYPDNYTESLQTYLEYTGQVDGEGRKFSTNTEADGRFHSKWLNMMYPRLYLARNLLREDGAIFISIDDHEVENLRRLCNEVFGEESFIGLLVWRARNFADARPTQGLSVDHEYVCVYGRAPSARVTGKQRDEGKYSNPDQDPRGPWTSCSLLGKATREQRPNLHHDVEHPETGEVFSPPPETGWICRPETFQQLIADNRILWPRKQGGRPRVKVYLNDLKSGVLGFPSVIDGVFTSDGTKEMRDLFEEQIFAFPKPSLLLRDLVIQGVEEDGIVLDFFAGSGSLAQAVLDQNAEDGGNRNFILVQLPEPTNRADYPTIADITKERLRRVIKNLNDADKGQLRPANAPKPDRGFRVFSLATSNFKPWDGDKSKDAAALQKQLFDHLEHVLPDRSEQDLLFEILLKDGFELTTPVKTFDVQGFRVYSVAGGELLLCLQDKLTHELIQALADKKASRVVFLDRGFHGNDQLKANAAKLFASRAGENFKKFKTV